MKMNLVTPFHYFYLLFYIYLAALGLSFVTHA